MRLDRLRYRVNQFWRALRSAPAPADIELARQILSPNQMALFLRMLPYEQAHSLRVFKKIWATRGQNGQASNPDLWVAALLHDIGKIRHPLYIWERVAIVLARAFLPRQMRHWGGTLADDQALYWRKPFVVAEQHPDWGAELAHANGASPLAVSLIRRHQNHLDHTPVNLEDQLLQLLQTVDHSS